MDRWMISRSSQGCVVKPYQEFSAVKGVGRLLGGGVQGQKSWKHYFEITGDPKGPPSGSTFW